MNLLVLVSIIIEQGEWTPITLGSLGIYIYRNNSGMTYLCNILDIFVQTVFQHYTKLRWIGKQLRCFQQKNKYFFCTGNTVLVKKIILGTQYVQ